MNTIKTADIDTLTPYEKERVKFLTELGDLHEQIHNVQTKLDNLDDAIENNTFDSIETAENRISDRLYDRAWDHCRERGRHGADKYTQLFMVNGVKYLCTFFVEWNRYDKQYYYVESSTFTYKPVTEGEPV